MSRPKTPKSKCRSRVGPTEVKPVDACSCGSSDSTPDQIAKAKHRVDEHKEPPAEERPWSEWVWYEDGQICYRGRKDKKGEWEYEFATLPKEKERPYTPPKQEPIEYLIEELKTIWEPRLVEIPGETVVTVTGNDPPKKDGVGPVKAAEREVLTEEQVAKEKEESLPKGEGKESTTPSTKRCDKHEKHEKHERVRKERPAEGRGRQLERRHFNPKERKDKIEAWRKAVE